MEPTLIPDAAHERRFEMYVPLVKSWSGDGGRLYHHGIVADESRDLQADQVRHELLTKSFDYLRRWGKFNLEHRRTDIGDVLDCGSMEAEEVQKTFGREIEGRGTYVYGDLYPLVDDRLAPSDLKEAHHRLLTGARMGYSMQGMLARRPTGEITAALVHRIALTPQPVNTNSFAVLCKSLTDVLEEVESGQGSGEDLPLMVICPEPLEKARVFDLGRRRPPETPEEVVQVGEDLFKAMVGTVLEAGSGVNAAAYRGGRALQRENERSALGDTPKRKRRRKGVDLGDVAPRGSTYESPRRRRPRPEKEETVKRETLRKALGDLSADEVCARLCDALNGRSGPDPGTAQNWWVRALYEDYAIAELGRRDYRVPFEVRGAQVVITGEPVEVVQRWTPVENAEVAPLVKSFVRPHTRRLRSGKAVQVRGYETKRQPRREPMELRWGDAHISIDRRNHAYWRHPSGQLAVKLTDEQADELRRIMRGEHQPYRAPYPPAQAAALRIEEWYEDALDRAREKAMKQRMTKSIAPLGSGERFAALKRKLSRRRDVTDPDALAAWIGRRKLGKQVFQKLAAAGRTRARRRRKQ